MRSTRPVNASSQPTLSTHHLTYPLSPLYQRTLSNYPPLNTHSQRTSSTHFLNPPSPTLNKISTHLLPPYRPTLSHPQPTLSHPINPLSPTLSAHSLNPPSPTLSRCRCTCHRPHGPQTRKRKTRCTNGQRLPPSGGIKITRGCQREHP